MYDFDSVETARTANCHGMFEDKEKFAIAEYEVTEKLINSDVDWALSQAEINKLCSRIS